MLDLRNDDVTDAIACTLYGAQAEDAGWRDAAGNELRAWPSLTEAGRGHWRAVVMQAERVFCPRGDRPTDPAPPPCDPTIDDERPTQPSTPPAIRRSGEMAATRG